MSRSAMRRDARHRRPWTAARPCCDAPDHLESNLLDGIAVEPPRRGEVQMVQRVSGVTMLLCGVATMAGGCGDNESVAKPPPALTPGDPVDPGDPGHPGGPGACDATWHDFQHGTELDD